MKFIFLCIVSLYLAFNMSNGWAASVKIGDGGFDLLQPKPYEANKPGSTSTILNRKGEINSVPNSDLSGSTYLDPVKPVNIESMDKKTLNLEDMFLLNQGRDIKINLDTPDTKK